MSTTTVTTCKKIDIHSHILPYLDHGSSSIKKSIEMLTLAKEYGITDIICTPHYKYDNSNYLKVFNKLNKHAKKLDINLYIGNEVLLNNSTFSEIRYNQVLTLNSSNYILIEFNRKIIDTIETIIDFIEELIELNYIIIIAHPELYKNILNKKKNIKDLKNLGVLFQINAHSFYKKRKYKNYIKYMFKNNLVDFVASDIHEFRITYKNYDKLCKYVIKKHGYDYAYKIFYSNPLKIISKK